MVKNFLNDLPGKQPEEFFEDIIKGKNFRLERIVSDGHSSPPDFWYDQDQNEFVLLLSGSAQLEFQDNTVVNLTPGDSIDIKAHSKHRVSSTSPSGKTVWLAIFYE